MAFSLMNGLSSAGAGLASYAAETGLAAQKADLARQSLVLADQLQGTRESAGRQEAAGIATAAATAEHGFQAGESALTRGAAVDLEQLRLGGTASEGRLSRENQIALEKLRLSQPPETIRVLQYLAPETFGSPPSGSTTQGSASVDGVSPDPSVSMAPTSTPSTPSAAARATSDTSPTDATGATPKAPPTLSASALANPVTGQILRKLLGEPIPGSEDAIRRAIANGVASDPVWKDKGADLQAAETKKRLASASASLSSDALDTIADRTLAGDTTALTGLGYGEGGAANRAAAQERITEKLKAKGLTGSDLAASIAAFGGEKAGARTAGTREANVGMAVTEAQLFMPLALEASKLVPRTQFPTLNSIMQAAEKGVGGESVVRLAVATNSLVNAYSRAITPSGIPTEGNQARARELLDKAWSDGQYAAAIDQLGKEMKAAKQSPIQQQAEQAARIAGRPSPNANPPATPPPTGQQTDQPAASSPAAPATPAAAPVDPAARDVGKTYPLPNGKMGIWRGTGWELAP